MFEMEPGNKHSSEECLQIALEEIRKDPSKIKFHVNLLLDYDRDVFNMKLWPGVDDPANWTRTSTKRPGAKELNADNDMYWGTDMVVRTFVNDLWESENRVLEVKVTETQGELTTEWTIVW